MKVLFTIAIGAAIYGLLYAASRLDATQARRGIVTLSAAVILVHLAWD